MSDAMTVVGEQEDPAAPTAKLIVGGLVLTAALTAHEGRTRLRVRISGTRGSAWTTFEWGRAPDDHEHRELAREVATSVEFALHAASALLAEIDPDPRAARAFLLSLAYLAIAAWRPVCVVAPSRLVGFRPAYQARNGGWARG